MQHFESLKEIFRSNKKKIMKNRELDSTPTHFFHKVSSESYFFDFRSPYEFHDV